MPDIVIMIGLQSSGKSTFVLHTIPNIRGSIWIRCAPGRRNMTPSGRHSTKKKTLSSTIRIQQRLTEINIYRRAESRSTRSSAVSCNPGCRTAESVTTPEQEKKRFLK